MKWGKVPNFGKDKGKGEERKGKRMTEKGEREGGRGKGGRKGKRDRDKENKTWLSRLEWRLC